MPELHDMADSLAVLEHDGLGRHDLLFKIEQKLLDASTRSWGKVCSRSCPKGTASCAARTGTTSTAPDDIYVSPSQIKRFDLRTGDTVSGQVRPPKEWERYLALLKVERVNDGEPEAAKSRTAFDNLGRGTRRDDCAWRRTTAT
jgi:transcription termination factor Rho